MAGPRKGKGGTDKLPEIEPGAWERFERAVDVVAKSKPKPRRKADDKPSKPTTKKAKPKKP